MTKLTIILATRNRPHLLVPTVRTTVRNLANADTRLVIVADEDDEATVLTRPEIERIDPRVAFMVTPRPPSLGEKYNAGMAAAPADVYLVMVDYAPHVTEGFDQRILDAAAIYPDGYAVVYNWHANLSFPQINAVTAKVAERMGGIYPALYPYWWIDHHLDDIARMIGRIVFAEVQIDTSARQERPGEPWTQGKRETWFWALLFDVLSEERQETARAIIAADDFDETAARKRALVNNIPLVVHHSMLVNAAARRDAGADLSTDDWYEHAKAAGLAKMAQHLDAGQMNEVAAMQAQIAAAMGQARAQQAA